MKRIITAILTAALAASMFSACGADQTAETASSSVSVSESSSVSSSSSSSEAASETSSASTSESTSETSVDEFLSEFQALPVLANYKLSDCVELGEYKGLEVTDPYKEATDEEVESYINSQLSVEAVADTEAVLAEGDTANIDFEGKIDGEAFSAGSSTDYDLVIGSNSFIEGFEDALIGMKAGETKDIELTFPADYWDESYRNKDVVFTVTLNSIKRAAQLTDEWVQANSEYNTVDEYRAYAKEYLNSTNREAADSTMMNDAWNQAFANAKFKAVPEDLMQELRSDYDEGMDYVFQYYGMTKEEYLSTSGVTEEEYNQYREAYAQETVENRLLTDAIWEAEGLSENDEGYAEVCDKISKEYGMTYDEIIAQYGEESVKATAKMNYVMVKLVEYAVIK